MIPGGRKLVISLGFVDDKATLSPWLIHQAMTTRPLADSQRQEIIGIAILRNGRQLRSLVVPCDGLVACSDSHGIGVKNSTASQAHS